MAIIPIVDFATSIRFRPLSFSSPCRDVLRYIPAYRFTYLVMNMYDEFAPTNLVLID